LYPPYYRRAVAIVDAEQLRGVMLEKLAELFDEERTSLTRVRSRHHRAAYRYTSLRPNRPRLLASLRGHRNSFIFQKLLYLTARFPEWNSCG
jgi:hypothetical protein